MIKKTLMFMALILTAAVSRSGEPMLPGLPGMQEDAAAAAAEAGIQRPDSQRVLAELTAELRLSAKQEERITDAVDKKSREFDKLLKEYDKVSAEEKKWRFKGNELKYRMNTINKGMPDLIRDFLDDDQRQNYDVMLAAKDKPAQAKVNQEEPAAVSNTLQPAKKKRLIRRKKLPRAGTDSSAMPSQAPGDAALSDDEPGLTMVDKEPAAPRKKRVLRKKSAVAASRTQTGDTPGGSAGAAPADKAAPAAEEDAGSYP